MNSEAWSARSSGRSGRGHSRPPGLRGHEIGMYYRNLAQKRKTEQGNTEPKIHLGASVSVPAGVQMRVHECLQKFLEKNEREKDNVSMEFEFQFRRLLSVKFDEFLASSRELKEDLYLNDIDNELSQRLKTELLVKVSTDQYRRLLKQRQKLPAMKQHDHIVQTIKDNQVVLIVGSTGCGKTTQIPQMLLDEFIYQDQGALCQIVCTQPRRISAITVAERVAYERCEKLGQSVGYQIRLECVSPREHGGILYCTTGVLLQKMQSNPLMNELNIVILDEIHERSVETDLLMALLKKILPYRPDLKVILMSATVSENDFYEYFDHCCKLHIEGTLFPVTMYYLEDILQETGFCKFQNMPHETAKHGRRRKVQQQNQQRNQEYSMFIEPYLRQIRDKYDAQVIQALRCSDSEGCCNMEFLEYLIFYICEHKPPGAILVFLPGYDKIAKLHALLQKPTQLIGQRLQHTLQVFPLHSMMPTVNQQNVFKPTPPGVRKVILSTIIAETSVTIEDIVYVINTGRTKTSSYNVEQNIQTLEETWVTWANTQQRRGRAGRVQPGICFNLFSKARERTMKDVPTPEILCCKLESVILRLKLLHISNVFEFFESLISSPNPAAVQRGIDILKRINALDENDMLTPLGMHLARLPIDPQMGKMVMMGALFRCLDPITSVAAGLSFKSPFYTPLGQEQKVDRIKSDMAANSRSDHLLIHNVLINFGEAIEDGLERDFCYKNYLSLPTLTQLQNMKQQFTQLLQAACFIESSSSSSKSSNVNAKSTPLLRAIIAAGLYPNMAHLRKVRQIKNRVQCIHSMSTPEESRVNFHPSSVNSGISSFDSHYFVYFLKQKSNAVYLMDATMVFPMALIIFGDAVEMGQTEDQQCYISVGKSYYFRCDQTTGEMIIYLRECLEWLLRKKALYPSPVALNSHEEYLIKAIQVLLSLDEVCAFEDQYLSSDENT